MIPILISVTCALGLCIYAGWGLTRLALPQPLRDHSSLFVPLVGYALTIWVGYMGVSTALNLRWSLVLLLLAATALNVLAWRRGMRPLAAIRDHAILLVVLVITLLAGIWPLLQYGYLTAIGHGWDTESYWPMVQHLLDYPVARIPEAPINPLRNLVSDPPGIGLTLGFSVFQGFTMLISQQSAIDTFAPLLALLRALGVLAAYAWFHTTMGLRRPAALLAAALTAAGALLLWVGYFNFGMQLSAWPLLGAGMAIGLATVDDLVRRKWAAWPVVILGAIVLAALPVAYYPALTIWGPMALMLGITRVIEAVWPRNHQPLAARLPAIVPLAGAAGGLALLVALLASLTIRDYYAGFSFRYSLIEPKIGPDRFIAATDILGLTTFRLVDGGAQPPAVLVLLASALAAILILAAIILRPPTSETPDSPALRLRWLGILAAVVAYLAWLRFGRPYEYAYMKGSSYAGFVAWGLAALGWQALWDRVRTPLLRGLVGTAAAIPLLVAIWAQTLTVTEHSNGPAIFTHDLVAFQQAAPQIPSSASVAISSHEAFTGPNNGLFATILYDRTIWGRFNTAYDGQSYWPVGQMPQYALLAAAERPWPLALGGKELWRSSAAALYQLPETTTLLGRTEIYRSAPPSNPHAPAAMAVWRRAGPYHAAEPANPLTILVGDTLRYGPGQPEGAARTVHLRLQIASLQAQQVNIGYGNVRTPLDVPAGVSTIEVTSGAPAILTITPEQRLALIEATMRTTEVAIGQPRVIPETGMLAWDATAELRGPIIRVRMNIANPARHALRAELTIIEDTFDSPRLVAQLLGAAPLDGIWQVDIDPIRGASEARIGKTPVPLLAANLKPEPADGAYFGILTLYAGEETIAREPLFTMHIQGKAITSFTPIPYSVEASLAGSPAGALPSTKRALLNTPLTLDNRAAAIEQIILARKPAWPGAAGDAPFPPGAQINAQLFWHAIQPDARPLMVSLQVIGEGDRKWAQWDGPSGGEWRPIQGWQSGDHVRQDVPLALDPTTPPGTYRLLLVVYDPASGAPQPAGGQQVLQVGEITVR